MGMPINSLPELFINAAARKAVATVEAALGQVSTIGTALAKPDRAQAATSGTTFVASGFAATTKSLDPIMRSLQRDGFDAHAIAIPQQGLASVTDGVLELQRSIDANAGTGPIHLVGHSKGGTVIQSWFAGASVAQKSQVESITLLASTPTGQVQSPAQQIQSAWTAPIAGPATRIIAETLNSSPTMTAIREAQISSHVRATSIISDSDGLLSPAEAAWKGGHDVVLTGADAPDHMHTLVSSPAYDTVVGAILGRSR